MTSPSPWWWLPAALLTLIAVGIVVRGKGRECWSFLGYVLLLLGLTVGTLAWPAVLYRWPATIHEQVLSDLLRVATAIELGARSVWLFPGARSRLAFALLIVAGLVVALRMPTAPDTLPPGMGTVAWAALVVWRPRVLLGTAWLLTAVAALVVWYRIPISEWQRAILLGLVTYLAGYVVVLGTLAGSATGVAHAAHEAMDVAAFSATCAWWGAWAWRREPAVDLPVSLPAAFRGQYR